MRHSIVLIRAALCQHSASSSPKEANMIDGLLWLFEKQLLNRHTMASNYLASIFRPFRHRGREREREGGREGGREREREKERERERKRERERVGKIFDSSRQQRTTFPLRESLVT